jgi:flagellar L-ring protein precursor FlgH
MHTRWLTTVRWSLVSAALLVVGMAADAPAPSVASVKEQPKDDLGTAPTFSQQSTGRRLVGDGPLPKPGSYSSAASKSPTVRRPITMAEASWTYQKPEEKRELKLNDLIVVVVDEKSQVNSEGQMDRRKKADGTFALADWIGLDGLAIRPDPQTEGEPTISGQMQSKYRAESELETRDSMKFRISCRVVDIRPNGNLIIEGRRSINNNEDAWEMWLMGAVRAEDVLPNNTVLSENVAELRIIKRESGHVRDGYRRGFLMRFLDRFSPI